MVTLGKVDFPTLYGGCMETLDTTSLAELKRYVAYCQGKMTDAQWADHGHAIELLILSAKRIDFAKKLAGLKPEGLIGVLEVYRKEGLLQ